MENTTPVFGHTANSVRAFHTWESESASSHQRPLTLHPSSEGSIPDCRRNQNLSCSCPTFHLSGKLAVGVGGDEEAGTAEHTSVSSLGMEREGKGVAQVPRPNQLAPGASWDNHMATGQ